MSFPTQPMYDLLAPRPVDLCIYNGSSATVLVHITTNAATGDLQALSNVSN